jgi:hypothetical protein
MRTSQDILASVKPFFDRLSDGLKVVGSGNTGGLVAMVAAINTIKDGYPHAVILLKPAAVIFAIGILLFALAYLALMHSYIHSEHYVSILHPNDENATPDEAKRLTMAAGPQRASKLNMNRALKLGIASTYIFFLGFFVAFVALIRY